MPLKIIKCGRENKMYKGTQLEDNYRVHTKYVGFDQTKKWMVKILIAAVKKLRNGALLRKET